MAEKLGDTFFKEFEGLGDELKKGLWNEDNKRFLRLIATDMANLTVKMLASNDAAKKQRYRRSIALLQNHVEVLALSRLNVAELEVRGVVSRLFSKTLGFVVDTTLQRAGIAEGDAR